MKAYKVFGPDWKCRDFQYKVGGIYEINGKPILCKRGFHACIKASNCFNYYEFDSKNKVAEVELLGIIDGLSCDKQVTNKIKIVRELKWDEVLMLVNTGKDNTGNRNSGDWNSGNNNSGNRNSGYRNSGNRNSGDWNSGNRNSGYRNSGNRNSGDWNSGNRNSGYRNSGNRNSGDWNSGNRNSGDNNSGDWNSGNCHTGFFNSENPKKHYIFNKLVSSDDKVKFEKSYGFKVCKRFKLVKYRIRTETGKYGDFRYMDYKASWRSLWSELTLKEKKSIIDMPFFDSDIFYDITGIKTK